MSETRALRATGRQAAARRLISIAGAVLLVLGLSSCAIVEGPTPVTPTRTPPPVPDTPPSFVPGGDASENLPFFTQVLTDYSKGDRPIEGKPIVDAIAAAGFDRTAMQVSFDRTKTNLVADSIYVSVRFGEECLIGQFVTGTRELAVMKAPALGPDKNICLIGTTRPIDW